MIIDYVYLYLLSPLHTGGTTQEGNLVGIARESHTQLPYIPSSSIRGRLRASIEDKDRELRKQLFGPELEDITGNGNQDETNTDGNSSNDKSTASQLEQGDIWIGDGSLLWIPVPSLSHGVVWVSCPMLLKRWGRLLATSTPPQLPEELRSNINLICTNLISGNQKQIKPIYLKDAVIKDDVCAWSNWQEFVPQQREQTDINQVLLLPDRHFATITQMSLWRQVKIKLDEHKSVNGGFRYEEAIPPDTMMYFPWGVTSQVNNNGQQTEKAKKLSETRKKLAEKYEVTFQVDNQAAVSRNLFIKQLEKRKILQIGGQESLGRGFVQQWLKKELSGNQSQDKTVMETHKS